MYPLVTKRVAKKRNGKRRNVFFGLRPGDAYKSRNGTAYSAKIDTLTEYS